LNRFCPPALLVVLVLALSTLAPGGASDEFLANGGLETGDPQGWTSIDADLQAVAVPHSGNWAGRLASNGLNAAIETHQRLYLSGNRTYELSGWVLQDDPSITTSLRIVWFDANDQLAGISQSIPLATPDSAYRRLTTGPLVPPAGTTRLQAEVSVQGLGTYSIIFDDMSLAGELLPTTDTPVPTATPASTSTVHPTGVPSGQPTAPPTLTRTPTPTATPKPTPTPLRTPIPTPAEPRVFQQLTNGSFEDLRGDGTPYGWRKIGGTLGSSSSSHSGSWSLSLSSDTTSTKWAYQIVSVHPGAYYQASTYAMQTGSGDSFLRISWYDTSDGSGEAIVSDDSTSVISQSSNRFALLQTDPIEAPSSARSASVRFMFRPGGASGSTAYFDDAALGEVSAPTEAPPATPTPTPAPTLAPSPGASVTPPSNSSRTATPAPTQAPGPTPRPSTPTPVPEPGSFASLVNGGFEVAREDGTPYGWHKVGGEFAVTDEQRIEGTLALSLSSDTTSTKWAYQAVTVEPGAYYSAEAWGMNASAADVLLLRVSWYASNDGEGAALDSVDSVASVTGAATGFRLLSTGSVQASGNARSARIRLLLQPATSDATRAFFDDVHLTRVSAPAASNPRGGSVSSQNSGGTIPAGASNATPVSTPLGAQSTPGGIVHVTTVPRAAESAVKDGGSPIPWPALMISLPVVGIVALAAQETIRRRLRSAATEAGSPPRSEE